MSNYWNLHCKTCGAYSETDINHGENILRDVARLAHECRAIVEANSEWLSVNVEGYGTELAWFAAQHADHEMELSDEYGNFEPGVLPEKVEEDEKQ